MFETLRAYRTTLLYFTQREVYWKKNYRNKLSFKQYIIHKNELLFIPFIGGVIIANWIYFYWHLFLFSIMGQSQTVLRLPLCIAWESCALGWIMWNSMKLLCAHLPAHALGFFIPLSHSSSQAGSVSDLSSFPLPSTVPDM